MNTAIVNEPAGATASDQVLQERLPSNQGQAWWFAVANSGGAQWWERVRSLPQTEFAVEPGIIASAAMLIRARQMRTRWWDCVRNLLGPRERGQLWTIPNGAAAEQCGDRQTDALVVWGSDTTPLAEGWVRARWPQARQVRALDRHYYLVSGVQPPAAERTAQLSQVEDCPRQQSEEALVAARRRGDPREEATALTDLALIELNQKNGERAVTLLEQALALAKHLGDPSLEADILSSLGWAHLLLNRPPLAVALLQEAVGRAQKGRDSAAELVAQKRLGHACARIGDHARCLAAFHAALQLATALGHGRHEADLHWALAAAHADRGERDSALHHAQAAVETFQRIASPQAPWYAEHLRRYRAGETHGQLGNRTESEPGGMLFGDMLVSAGIQATPHLPPPSGPRKQGPGILRMAVTATQAMVQFLGSGLKTVSRSELERRLRTCAACPHHTGLRCRLCGCFTNAKARLPYEECPIRKW